MIRNRLQEKKKEKGIGRRERGCKNDSQDEKKIENKNKNQSKFTLL